MAAGGSSGASAVSPIPTDGLVVWLTADRGLVASNGLAQQWLDQSSQGMDAIQTATNLQPKFEAAGLNGKPTVEFDGVDDLMKFQSGFADFSNGLSWFAVVNPKSADCSSIMEMSNGTEIQDVEIGVYQKIWQYEVLNGDATGGTVASQPELLGVVQHPDMSVELRLDSMQLDKTTFDLPEKIARQQNFLGGTLYADCNVYQGQISEIVLYSRAVTDVELIKIEAYLHQHWSLAF